MPRPAKKKTRVLAKAQKQGELQALIEHEFKTFTNKKHLWVSIKHHMGKMIDRIDPLKLGTVIFLTILIKTSIEWAEEAIASVSSDSAFKTIYRWGLGVISFLIPKSEEEMEAEQRVRMALDTPIMEVLQWGLSFASAWFLIEHGTEMLVQGKGVVATARAFLGAFAV